MGGYLQNYGAGEEQRNRKVRNIIIVVVALLVLWWILYLVFHNYSEKRTVKQFLAQINARNYTQAYSDWGCSVASPCRNYDYNRFLQDWGPNKKITSPWKIDSVDGCRSFVTVNVLAGGVDLESLGVERGTKTLMFAPDEECEEPQWRWKQFFQRMFGHGAPASKPPLRAQPAN